ncbi:uncharacterized protein LOC122958077 isoform X2 [Acropora millepora]|uniref:uncharacterized protein LOC122958077 isoform X2 n=1 Tax=Acropora millepora TaxID=45264 RepID=UPI001CF5335B|nr:uncharacterized protein LOC122958077 isoform X2 [Acropora millepora]
MVTYLRDLLLCSSDKIDGSQQKPATKNMIVYRAGNKFGPSFDLKDESINEVWLVTCPKLFFPLGQDLPASSKEDLEEVCLWETDLSKSSNLLKWYPKFDDKVIQVKLNDSRNSTDAVKEIQTHLGSLVWRRTTVPQCEKGFPLSLCNPLIHGVEQYMKNHLPTTSKELNYHAELKAACNWRWSGERLYLDMEESLDGRRKIAAKEILKTWKKSEAELLLNEIYSPGLCFSSFDVSGYIQALEKYLRIKVEDDSLKVEMATVNEEEQFESAIGNSSGKKDKIHSICLLPIRLSVY